MRSAPSRAPSRPRTVPGPDDPLRIAFLTYRGKPHVGGQGVYTRHLTKALVDMGHHAEVLSGQPFPIVDERVPLVELPSLDIYNDHFPMRMPGIWELKDRWDWAEVTAFSSGTFPEPLAFSLRAWDHLRQRQGDFDLVQDNQCLGYGLLLMERMGLPVLGTVHHPITVDRRIEMEHARSRYERLAKARWYAFTKMQSRVAQRLTRIITVSQNSYDDICRTHGVSPERLHIVPVGVDPDLFQPRPEVTRQPGRLITTASADVALKGLSFLLEAMAKLRTERDVRLTIIGKPREGHSADLIDQLGLRPYIDFVSGVSDERIVELYAEAELAVVPSLYEGFSLPAIEAMCTGICLVATDGGALPEVTGTDGETVLQCKAGDVEALTVALRRGLDDADLRARVGAAGRQRVVERWSWKHCAQLTVDQYREVLQMPQNVEKLRRNGRI